MKISNLRIGDVCLLKPGMYLSAIENKFYSLDKHIECLVLDLDSEKPGDGKAYASLLAGNMVVKAWEKNIIKINTQEEKLTTFKTQVGKIERNNNRKTCRIYN